MFFNNETSEEKKAKFREYLQEHGVIEAITGIFNKLILAKEKPENPIDFIRQELGDTPVPQETVESLENELEEANREIRRLRKVVKDMGLGELLDDDNAEEPETEKPEGSSSVDSSTKL